MGRFLAGSKVGSVPYSVAAAVSKTMPSSPGVLESVELYTARDAYLSDGRAVRLVCSKQLLGGHSLAITYEKTCSECKASFRTNR